ncbi:MAG: hypothetical protein WC773_01490 [Patescibacteria group bacterium]
MKINPIVWCFTCGAAIIIFSAGTSAGELICKWCYSSNCKIIGYFEHVEIAQYSTHHYGGARIASTSGIQISASPSPSGFYDNRRS